MAAPSDLVRYILRGRMGASGGTADALARQLEAFRVHLDLAYGLVVMDPRGSTFVARVTATPEDMARSAEALGLDYFPDLRVSK